ncbi:MAG: hypothetical protein AAB920_02840 [Patescibacteria group bacterium]
MNKLNAHKVGLVFGGLFGITHTALALMVLTGMAKGLMDWIFSLHFLVFQYEIAPFSFANAIVLIIITSLVGYVMGCVFGWLWNLAHNASHGQ